MLFLLTRHIVFDQFEPHELVSGACLHLTSIYLPRSWVGWNLLIAFLAWCYASLSHGTPNPRNITVLSFWHFISYFMQPQLNCRACEWIWSVQFVCNVMKSALYKYWDECIHTNTSEVRLVIGEWSRVYIAWKKFQFWLKAKIGGGGSSGQWQGQVQTIHEADRRPCRRPPAPLDSAARIRRMPLGSTLSPPSSRRRTPRNVSPWKSRSSCRGTGRPRQYDKAPLSTFECPEDSQALCAAPPRHIASTCLLNHWFSQCSMMDINLVQLHHKSSILLSSIVIIIMMAVLDFGVLKDSFEN